MEKFMEKAWKETAKTLREAIFYHYDRGNIKDDAMAELENGILWALDHASFILEEGEQGLKFYLSSLEDGLLERKNGED